MNGRPDTTARSAPDEPASRPSGLVVGTVLRLFGALSGALLRLLGATWRVEVVGPDPRRERAPTRASEPTRRSDPSARAPAHLAALLHQSLVVAAWLFRDAGYCVAVSRSQDGSLVAATLRALGYAEPARGSSSRGGSAAFMGLLRRLASGTTVAVLVDGPRGPAGVAKPGIAALARHSATPIQPVAVAARPALRLGSWDRSLVPLPFARVVCAFGEPIPAPEDGSGKSSEEALANEVASRLADLARTAEAGLDGPGSSQGRRSRPLRRTPPRSTSA